MSSKYQILRPLGCGHRNTVYLARHTSLERDIVIKMIPHDLYSSCSEIFEARLLRQFCHPGIPIIYDIEEDGSYYYIMEEYLPGQSLEELLLHQSTISQGLFMKICEELCDILSYLHSFKPHPVVYRDLKPEHIILCQNQVKLIDFDICIFANSKGNNSNFLGNPLYSAPECFTEDTISTKADIYSLGKLLLELSKRLDSPVSLNIQQIFQKSISTDPYLRFETVEDFVSELKNELKKNDGSGLVKKIAVVGSFHGCGATHLAISLVSCLNYLGLKTTYYEINQPSYLISASKFPNSFKQDKGVLFHKFFRGIPAYGPGISVSSDSNDIEVYDYGTEITRIDVLDYDLVLFVCGGAIWQRSIVTDQFQSLQKKNIPFITICNACNHDHATALAKQLGIRIIVYPYDADPFAVSRSKCDFFTKLLRKTGGQSLSLKNTKKYLFRGRP